MSKRSRSKRPNRPGLKASEPAAGRRYTLPDVLTLIPKTKRSQMELLVRTGKVIPAWPSPGTGRDRAYDAQNLVEFAFAAELIALGFVGERLTQFFRVNMLNILDPRNPPDAVYLVVLPSADGSAMALPLVSRADLEPTVGIFDTCYVLNVKNIRRKVESALRAFEGDTHAVAAHDDSSIDDGKADAPPAGAAKATTTD